MDERKKIRKGQSTAKGKFTRVWKVYQANIMKAEGAEDISDVVKDMEFAYEELERKHADYMEVLDSDDEADTPHIQTAQDMMVEVYSQLAEGRAAVASLSKKGKVEPVRKDDVIPKVRVKKLDAPTFNGELMKYPSFRRDYRIHMEPVYGDDPYALKRCLQGDALSAVQGIDDDFAAMISRLDLKFGRPDKLASAIISRLKRLKPVADGENEKFIELVDTVESSWLEMKRLDMKEEISNVTIVSEIETLLPRTLLREWVIQKEEFQLSGRKDQFPDFLKFLVRERTAMEYMDDAPTRRHKELRFKTHVISQETDESDPDFSTMELLLKNQKQSEDTLRKVVEGLTQVIQAVGNSRSPLNNLASTQSGNYTMNNKGAMGNYTANIDKKCWLHQSDMHEIAFCPTFNSLNNNEKTARLKKAGACFCCLRIGHLSRQCLHKKPCNIIENGQACNRSHHSLLHRAYVEGSLFHIAVNTVNELQRKDEIILMISSVSCNRQLLTTFWDPGSNTSLITRRAAKTLGLQGKSVTLSITKAGNETTTTESKEYSVPLTDQHGNTWNITAYEMIEITGSIKPRDLTEVSSLFDELRGVTVKRPFGQVDLLIGTDCCSLLPYKVGQVNNLQLMKNQFGYCFRGSHSSFGAVDEHHVCKIITHLAGEVIKDEANNHILQRNVDKLLESFLDIESLGTYSMPRCGNCQCRKCPIGSNNYTIKEGRELKMIEDGLKYDSTQQEWTAHYPWKRDASQLPNNFSAAFGRLKSTEKRLQRAGTEYSESYHKQILDMIDRGVARKLSNEEINSSQPVHYIPHHEVLKPSKSTPLRIVFNSSAKFMGYSLNEFWAKGPCVMNDLYGILLRFRQYNIGIAGDLTKMYNTIKLSKRDQDTHRFLWRQLDNTVDPEHYSLTTVTFGDRPSAAIAAIALKKTAEMSKVEFPRVFQLIDKDSYVDDLITSVEGDESASTLMENTEQVLDKGGFKVKQWITSGSIQNQGVKREIIHYGEEKVLGMLWEPAKDHFRFRISIRFSKNKKGNDKSIPLKVHEIQSEMPLWLTRRMILSLIASIYDPLGFITPVTLGAKFLMRNLCIKYESKPEGKWDTPVDPQLWEEALKLFVNLFDLEKLRFPRCVKSLVTHERPTLIVFSDGSDTAFGAAAYVRWETSLGTFEARLLTSKNRIAPKKKITVPQLELCGALIGARLRKTIVDSMDYSFEKIYHLVDSSIVRAQIQKESYGFATFVAIRIGEIQSHTDPSEWWWIPSDENPADMVTRVTQADELSMESKWQRGPEFLRKPTNEWPISKEYYNQDLPDKIGVVMVAQSATMPDKINFSDIQLKRFNSFEKLIKVVAMIIKIADRRTFKGSSIITFKNKNKAEIEFVKYIQHELPDWEKRYKRLGPELNDDGLIVVGARMSKWLRENWNSAYFILLPPKSRFTELYAKHVHEEDHAAVDTTVAKIRSKYWIRRCAPMITRIKQKCITCRKRDKKVIGQIMGPLPSKRLQPSPPFFHCAVDLFGPFVIKDTVKKRTRGKGYGVMFTDLSSRACHIDVADGYDTNSFINVLRRFNSLRGVPKTLISDSGTQLVATTKEFRKVIEAWNWDEIYHFGERGGTSWSITKAADAPWENGCCEAMIKQAKRNLMLALGTNVLTILELQTIFYEVANLLNQRPIGTKTNNPEQGTYLCPNDLLLGRASSAAPSGFMEQATNLKARWQFVQRVANTFWHKWMRDFFHTLIIRSKWHTAKRNLQIGDVVLVKDSNTVRGLWKLAQVCDVIVGSDNMVRDVSIRYKQQAPGGEYRGVQDTVVRRSAHRLVVLLPVEEQI